MMSKDPADYGVRPEEDDGGKSIHFSLHHQNNLYSSSRIWAVLKRNNEPIGGIALKSDAEFSFLKRLIESEPLTPEG